MVSTSRQLPTNSLSYHIDCSVHVFTVRLSQKPESQDLVENKTYTAVKNNEYGANYYEIRGGQEMTPKLAAEIIQSMGKDADPRLKEKINNKEFYWKPVEPGGEQVISANFPPPPPPVKKERTSTVCFVFSGISVNDTFQPRNSSYKGSEFPFLLITLLICVGIFLGILITGFCLFMANLRKEPQFDRSSAVIYSKASESATEMRPMLRRDQQIEMLRQEAMESASVAPSMSCKNSFRNSDLH